MQLPSLIKKNYLIYSVILGKKTLLPTSPMSIITPNDGFVDVLPPSARGSKKLDETAYLQPFNLIYSLITSHHKWENQYIIKDIELKYSFYSEMAFFHQWNCLKLFSSLKNMIHFTTAKENQTFFNMVIEFLTLSPKVISQEQSEQFCFVFFIKTLLITKSFPQLLWCASCFTKLFQPADKTKPSIKQHITINKEKLFCQTCSKNIQYHTTLSISGSHYKYIYQIIFSTLYQNIEMGIVQSSIYKDTTKLMDSLLSSIFNKTWNKIIKS